MNESHGLWPRAGSVVQNKSLYSHKLLFEKGGGEIKKEGKPLTISAEQNSFSYVKIKYSLILAFLALALSPKWFFFLSLSETHCSPARLCLPQLRARFLSPAPIRISSLIRNGNRRDKRDGLSTSPHHRCEHRYWQQSPGFAGDGLPIRQHKGSEIFGWSGRARGTHPAGEEELCPLPSHAKAWHPACLRGFKHSHPEPGRSAGG